MIPTAVLYAKIQTGVPSIRDGINDLHFDDKVDPNVYDGTPPIHSTNIHKYYDLSLEKYGVKPYGFAGVLFTPGHSLQSRRPRLHLVMGSPLGECSALYLDALILFAQVVAPYFQAAW